MALNPSTNAAFTGRITAPDANYPYGSAQEESVLGANDGTPYIKERADDIFGFQQWLLNQAGIVPSGLPDNVNASDYGDALLQVINDNTPAGSVLVTTFTTSGTWNKNANTGYWQVLAVGAGGGGRGAPLQSSKFVAGLGGFGGGWARKYLSDSGITSATITIGTGGVGSSVGATDGTDSIYDDGTNVVTGEGGQGSTNVLGLDLGDILFLPNSYSSDRAGIGVGGDENVRGGAPTTAIMNGITPVTGTVIVSKGGASFFGSNQILQSANGTTTVDGADGVEFGEAGGGGAVGDNALSDSDGGNGAPGVIIIYEFL